MAPKRVCRASAIVVNDGKVLLVESKKSPGFWVPPGGTIEARERARDTVAREVIEETGLCVAVGRLLACREVWWDDHDTLELYFAAQPAVSAAAATEGTDHSCRWVPIARLEQLPHFPEALSALCELATSASEAVLELDTCDLRGETR